MKPRSEPPRAALYSLIIELRAQQATTKAALNHLGTMLSILERKIGVTEHENDYQKNMGHVFSQEAHSAGATFRQCCDKRLTGHTVAHSTP